jgi:hypothetical protein
MLAASHQNRDFTFKLPSDKMSCRAKVCCAPRFLACCGEFIPPFYRKRGGDCILRIVSIMSCSFDFELQLSMHFSFSQWQVTSLSILFEDKMYHVNESIPFQLKNQSKFADYILLCNDCAFISGIE